MRCSQILSILSFTLLACTPRSADRDRARQTAAHSVTALADTYFHTFVENFPIAALFLGVPETADTVDELWPWEPGPDGDLRLTGFFRGYAGETYLAQQEADAFEDRYGLRKLAPPT